VPTVFIENHNVVGAELNDPIQVDYKKKIGSEPTGKEHPELLKLKATPNHGHDNTIVNGIGRIGYMTGGTKARWTDEEMPLSFMEKSLEFIRQNQHHPFFLFYALTEPHVPRMPSTMFKGKSRLGFRGDAILQIDWTVGKIMESLKSLGLEKNTIIIFTSDNGPVLDDGYLDGAVTELNSHTPWGQLRGGKYSLLEAATRVPFIISWPLKIKPGVSDAMVCQMDFIASFSKLLDVKITPNEQLDSENTLNAFLGTSKSGRKILVEQSIKNFAIIQNEWKFIPPNNGPSNTGPLLTNIETGNSILPQLYHLKKDPGESTNLATEFPNKVKELDLLLNKTIQKNYQHR
jgi:hypothetical protein